MAGMIQIGDAIKFAEIAWQLYEFGWAQENNAGESYRAFGRDVHTLCTGLQRLDEAVSNVHQSLVQHGARNSNWLRADRHSISEIIGDYETTIHECEELLRSNQRYNTNTRAFRNIQWNINVMPIVEHLRSRIHMHNLRIEHALKPFQIDLINSVHQDLATRVMGVDSSVRELREDLHIALPALYPVSGRTFRQTSALQPSSIDIPYTVQGRLEAMFARECGPNSARRLSLQQLTDCFLKHFETINVGYHLNMDPHNRMPPINRYLELLKCQFLMHKIRRSPNLAQAPQISHWHGYINSLQENLLAESSQSDGESPDISSYGDEMFMFHLPPNPVSERQIPIRSHTYDILLDVSLDMGTNTDKWKTLQLLRRSSSDSQFRIVERDGYIDKTSTTEPKTIDFNIKYARLIPSYAFPVQADESPPPLAVTLEENGIPHSYTFAAKADLLLFQAALTGYKVSHMDSQAVVSFVKQRQDIETGIATIQLWIPRRIDGVPEARQDRERFHSLESQTFLPSDTERTSRANSMGSMSSGAAPSTGSWSSLSQEDARAVRLDSGPASTSHAMIRSPPRNPLLVLFMVGPHNLESPRTAMVCIKIEDTTKPNRQSCDCHWDPTCNTTVIEHSGRRTFKCQRMENRQDLLRLTRAADWTGLLRATLTFPTAGERNTFSGRSCNCPRHTVGEENKCVLEKRHEGLLGAARVYHWRQMSIWQDEQDNRVGYDVTSPLGRSLP